MPSHKIHLAIAKKINDKLNLNLDCITIYRKYKIIKGVYL